MRTNNFIHKTIEFVRFHQQLSIQIAKLAFVQINCKTSGPPVQRRSLQGRFWLITPESTRILGGRVAWSSGIKAAPVKVESTDWTTLRRFSISITWFNWFWKSWSSLNLSTKRGKAFSASTETGIRLIEDKYMLPDRMKILMESLQGAKSVYIENQDLKTNWKPKTILAMWDIGHLGQTNRKP